MQLEIKFQGGLADEHKIPAYEGVQSLEGISRSILIVSSYLIQGRVRRKNFDRVPVTFNLISHRPGSFETVYEISYQIAAWGGEVVLDSMKVASGALLAELLKHVYRRVTGQPDIKEISQALKELQEEKSGDIDALSDAAEPSIRLGHNVINRGVINININRPTERETQRLSNLNPDTKKFIWEKVINNNPRVKIFSISSFDANQGTGRAYDLEEKRTIPYELSEEADRITVLALLDSVGSYTRTRMLGDNMKSDLAIKYTSVESATGQIKKIRIITGRKSLLDL